MIEDEQTLLHAIADGDLEAFESLYRGHKDQLLTVTMMTLRLDQPAAEDVLHDVFVQLLKQAGQLSARTSLRAYLVSCCLNRGRDVLRRQQTGRRVVQNNSPTLARSPDPVAQVERTEQQTTVMNFLACLPDEQREVVTLHLHADMTFKDISDSLGISINTAKSRYRYALQKLRTIIPAFDSEGV